MIHRASPRAKALLVRLNGVVAEGRTPPNSTSPRETAEPGATAAPFSARGGMNGSRTRRP